MMASRLMWSWSMTFGKRPSSSAECSSFFSNASAPSMKKPILVVVDPVLIANTVPFIGLEGEIVFRAVRLDRRNGGLGRLLVRLLGRLLIAARIRIVRVVLALA